MKTLRIRKATKKAAALALAAQMAGVQIAFPSGAPRLPAPAHVVLTGVRNRRRLMRKAERALEASINRGKRLKARALAKKVVEKRLKAFLGKRGKGDALKEDREAQCLINGMTNWQTAQWCRSEKVLKGGGKKPPSRDLETVRRFAALPHWKIVVD